MLYLECDCCTDTVDITIAEVDSDNSATITLPRGWEVFRLNNKQYTVCSADCREIFEDEGPAKED